MLLLVCGLCLLAEVRDSTSSISTNTRHLNTGKHVDSIIVRINYTGTRYLGSLLSTGDLFSKLFINLLALNKYIGNVL